MLLKQTTEEIIGMVGGAIVGAVAGSFAGWLGALVGALIGGLVGFGLGAAIDAEERRVSLHEHELDRVIGIEGGTMGTGLPKAIPAAQPTFDEDQWFI